MLNTEDEWAAFAYLMSHRYKYADKKELLTEGTIANSMLMNDVHARALKLKVDRMRAEQEKKKDEASFKEEPYEINIKSSIKVK